MAQPRYHSVMLRLLTCLCLMLTTAGCMAVLGYEPTPAELEAIRRGEDPRANEGEQKQGNAGESAQVERDRPAGNNWNSAEQAPAPTEGTVLRWVNSVTLVIEAADRRETVALAGESESDDFEFEQRRLDERMNRWTYGTTVRLAYPTKNEKGEPVYRDAQGRLLARID